MIRGWNELPDVTRDLPSIATFKHDLNSDNMKLPSYYFDGKNLGQIYHARLRTNCSSLNQHEAGHFTGISSTPSDVKNRVVLYFSPLY